MRLHCIAGQHVAAPGEVLNQGFGFSHCSRCGRAMIRSSREWRTVPRGFRVVWRHGIPRQTEVSATQLLFDLPSTGRSLTLPGASRGSRLREIFAILLMTTQFLAETAIGWLRDWRKSLLSPRVARARPIWLPSPAGPESPTPTP